MTTTDWKSLFEDAFAGYQGNLQLEAPCADPSGWLRRAVPNPPSVLLELLSQVDGVTLVSGSQEEEDVLLLLPAIDMAKETIFQREIDESLADLVVFGSSGDGRLFVMPASSTAHDVGVFDPDSGVTDWVSSDLSDFFRSYSTIVSSRFKID